MALKQKANPPLFDQIVEETIRTVTSSDIFDDDAVQQLWKLAADHHLNKPEAIMSLLRRPQE